MPGSKISTDKSASGTGSLHFIIWNEGRAKEDHKRGAGKKQGGRD